MELTPMLYHFFVRPKWFVNAFYNSMLGDCIDFSNKIILDFGCGIGSSSCLFEPKAYIGVDCDNNRIEYAKRLYPDYNFITMKERRLPVANHSIDHIIVLSVLHHISTESILDYLEEFRRVLQPHGSLVIAEPCLYERANLCNWYMSSFDRGNYIRSENEYLDIFRKANFKTKVLKRYNQLILYNKIVFSASPVK